jgi:ketol-acid reductoisomerase
MINNYSNTAQLKDLMTQPPMTAAQHAEIMRKRNEQRRKIEDAREQRQAEKDLYGERA